MKKISFQSAQVTVEYLLFVAVVVAVLIVFLGKNGTYEKSLKRIYNMEGNRVVETGKRIFF
jgi:hypothetical protein